MVRRRKVVDPVPSEELKVPEIPEIPVKSEFIMVKPVRGYMYEPFQRIPIFSGQATPVRLSNWVKDQVSAGRLRVCP